MKRLLILTAVLASAQALAVNEAIALKGPLAEQLEGSLCVSMECNAPGETSFTVSSQGSRDVKVTRFDGKVLLTEKFDDAPSNTQQLELAARVLKAIETPEPKHPVAQADDAKDETPPKGAVSRSKTAKKKAERLAKKKAAKGSPLKVASRLRSNG